MRAIVEGDLADKISAKKEEEEENVEYVRLINK